MLPMIVICTICGLLRFGARKEKNGKADIKDFMFGALMGYLAVFGYKILIDIEYCCTVLLGHG